MKHYQEKTTNKTIYIKFDNIEQKEYVIKVCKQAFELLSIADKTITYNEVLKSILVNGIKDLERYIKEQKGAL